MAYVGIDQSYSGFAVTILNASTNEPEVHLGKFPPGRHGTGVDRLLVIEHWLQQKLSDWDVDHACLEGYANGSKFGREIAGELGYAVKRSLRYHPQKLYPTIVPPTSLKKFVTGKGNAKKNEMLLGVFKRWGVEFTDDNEADSYALARLAQAIDTANTSDLPKFQQEVIEGLTPFTEMRR